MRKAILASAVALGVLTGAACNGGNDGAGTGSRVTDPALVPTSTPILQPVTFRIQNDEIQIQAGAGTTGGAAAPRTHTVESGQTCAEIAAQYGITVEALIRANRTINADCTNLRAGENIRIPAPPTAATGTPTPTGSGRTYTVQPGDTCSDIAANFGVNVDDLVRRNGLDPACRDLRPGDVLQSP
jgi:LysM repeat protein